MCISLASLALILAFNENYIKVKLGHVPNFSIKTIWDQHIKYRALKIINRKYSPYTSSHIIECLVFFYTVIIPPQHDFIQQRLSDFITMNEHARQWRECTKWNVLTKLVIIGGSEMYLTYSGVLEHHQCLYLVYFSDIIILKLEIKPQR